LSIKIFIDQGHNPTGYHNAGATGFGLYEENINFEVGTMLADLLRADPRFEVRVSRETPTTVLGTNTATSLAARVRGANNWPANYFISIHANANSNPAINGTEVYVFREGTQAYWLAQHVLNEIVRQAGTKDNGVRVNSGLFVLRTTRMPAILVELAYLSNPQDAAKLSGDLKPFALGIYLGLLSYFDFAPL